MHRLHKEIDHSLRFEAYRWYVAKIIKVQGWILLGFHILIPHCREFVMSIYMGFSTTTYDLNQSIISYENPKAAFAAKYSDLWYQMLLTRVKTVGNLVCQIRQDKIDWWWLWWLQNKICCLWWVMFFKRFCCWKWVE